MEKGVLLINGESIPTLLALSPEEQRVGLMNKQWPPPTMSFYFKGASYRPFWMANTPSPLDIVFARDNEIVGILPGEPHSTKMVGGELYSDFVAEFPRGTCDSQNISTGDKIFCFPESATKGRIY